MDNTNRLENKIIIDDKTVLSIQTQYLYLLHPLNNLQRLNYLNKLKHIKYFGFLLLTSIVVVSICRVQNGK